MTSARGPGLELLFLGTGNAFAEDGRAFSSFLLDGRYLFDCGPTILQQLRKAGIATSDIQGIFISHFHADHFYGLPFLFLDYWREQRAQDLWIAGPPGIEAKAEKLFELAFPGLPEAGTYRRRYVELSGDFAGELAGLPFLAAEVDHVPALRCFAFQAKAPGGTVGYSGDSRLCDGLLRLVPDADVLVLECACGDEGVHLCPDDLTAVVREARPGTPVLITHADKELLDQLSAYILAEDLTPYRF